MIRQTLLEYIPEGCPFIVGGGLIRDAILGGRPGDVDVWLPSNITVLGLADFLLDFCYDNGFLEEEITTVFRGPGYDNDGVNAVAHSQYSDVSNHWVLEVDFNVGQPSDYPKVNFMRTMVPWEGDAQAFFNGLMRAFDIDVCMMFMAWMPNESITNSRTVIMPRHLYRHWSLPFRDTARLGVNEIRVNAARAELTSATRLNARLEKICNKYAFRRDAASNVATIATEDLVAVPVALSSLMPYLNRPNSIPIPTLENSNEARPVLPTQGQVFNWD